MKLETTFDHNSRYMFTTTTTDRCSVFEEFLCFRITTNEDMEFRCSTEIISIMNFVKFDLLFISQTFTFLPISDIFERRLQRPTAIEITSPLPPNGKDG